MVEQGWQVPSLCRLYWLERHELVLQLGVKYWEFLQVAQSAPFVHVSHWDLQRTHFPEAA